MTRVVTLAAVLLLALAGFAQQPPTVTAQANTVYVGAEGRHEAAPDTALLQFNIAAQEETAKAAYERAGNAAEQIRQILRGQAIDPKIAEIGFFSLAPVYDWRQPKRKLVGYRVSSSVSLKLKQADFSKVAPIVQQLADIDVTENQSLNYTLDNIDAAKVLAVQDAFQRARGMAEAVTKAGGRSLGELLYSSVDTFEAVPILAAPMRMAKAGAATEAALPPTAEFSPQKVVVTARVNVIFGIK